MSEDPHDLDQADSAYDAGDYADQEFDADEAPGPVEACIGEEGEAEVAEHEGLQCEPDHLVGGAGQDLALG